jgi:hypothetical protein
MRKKLYKKLLKKLCKKMHKELHKKLPQKAVATLHLTADAARCEHFHTLLQLICSLVHMPGPRFVTTHNSLDITIHA